MDTLDLQPATTPAGDTPPVSGPYTYPDGCVVYGVAPFPTQSPLERAAQTIREASADLIVAQQAVALSMQPSGIVTASDVQQTPDTPDTPAA
jgi:hypothetical protein